jgi:hypothetical protein
MKTLLLTISASTLLSLFSFHAQAGQICKVSMMGRVCFEEGSPEAAAHMKGDAVAEAAAAKKKAADAGDKKVADNSK